MSAQEFPVMPPAPCRRVGRRRTGSTATTPLCLSCSMSIRPSSLATLCLVLLAGAATAAGSCRNKKNCKVVFTQQELKKRLTPLQYHVTQEKGTESAFAGEFTQETAEGTYKCVVCGTALFKSETKFDSSSGWPSFYDVISLDTITFTDDFSYGMHRVETSCSQCGAHLGHLFDDGPRPTGKRYCINSASLSFVPKDPPGAEGDSSSTTDVKKEL